MENNQNQTNATGGQTKTCKYCKQQIAKDAKICPFCRKKQGGVGKWIAIGAVVIIILAAIGGGSNKDKSTTADSQSTIDKNQEEQNTQENTDNIETEKETENEEQSTQYSVGDTAEYKDIQVTVLSYEESVGNDWGKPSDGNVFVFPEIEIVNNSSEEISISSMASFECYVDDYKVDFSSNAFMAISTEDNKQQLDGSIAPEKRLKGVLGIEVPADWNIIEIYYKDDVWLDSNFSFKIEK